MTCDLELPTCSSAVARWSCANGYVGHLCQKCLDHWFDNADDDDSLEPVAWMWLAA